MALERSTFGGMYPDLVRGALTSIYDGDTPPSVMTPVKSRRRAVEPSFGVWEDTPETKRRMTVPTLFNRIVTFEFEGKKVAWDGRTHPFETNADDQMLILSIPRQLKAHVTAEQVKELKVEEVVEGVPVEFFAHMGEHPTKEELEKHAKKLRRELEHNPGADYTRRKKWERELKRIEEGAGTAPRWRIFEATLRLVPLRLGIEENVHI